MGALDTFAPGLFRKTLAPLKDDKMNFQQGLALLTLLGTLTATSGHIGGSLGGHEKPRIYCGRVLASTLALLCYDDEMPSSKRSGNGNMYNNLLAGSYYDEPQQEADYGWPWMSVLKARALSGPRNKREMVVSECCDKPCTVKELKSYC